MKTANWGQRKSVTVLRALIAAVCLSAAGASVQAQDYPSKPIRVLVPFAPGGVVDVTARLLTQKMTERLGWNFIVENRPGGNGFIAVTAAAKSTPDGYTLLMAHSGEFAVNPALFPNIPYELEHDFQPITMVSDTPMLLVANSQAPFNTFQEMIAEERKNPGKLSFSSPGNGSVNHLAGEWLAMESSGSGSWVIAVTSLGSRRATGRCLGWRVAERARRRLRTCAAPWRGGPRRPGWRRSAQRHRCQRVGRGCRGG